MTPEQANKDLIAIQSARITELESRLAAALRIAKAGRAAAPHQHTGKNLVGDFDEIIMALEQQPDNSGA